MTSDGKKSGGRRKGTPNKKTVILREVLKVLDFDPASAVVELLRGGDLKDSEKLDASLRLMEFIYPKRKSIEDDSNDALDVTPAFAGLLNEPEKE